MMMMKSGNFYVAILSIIGLTPWNGLIVEGCSDSFSHCGAFSDRCHESGVRQVCRATCGDCSGGGNACSDSDPANCAQYVQYCGYNDWMKQNCKKTCNLCSTGTGTSSPTTSWSSCSKTCGAGTQSRNNCNSGTCEKEFQSCRTHDCPRASCSDIEFNRKGNEGSCCSGLSGDVGCGVTGNGQRVFNGVPAKLKDWPWMVALIYWGNTKELCGAALLSSKFILTAAHCFRKTGTTTTKHLWKAHTGILRLADAKESSGTGLKTITRHFSYSDTNVYQYDIAVVELQSAVPTTVTARPVCLPRGETLPHDTKCFVTGWGKSHHSHQSTDHLQEGEVFNYDREICRTAFAKVSSLSGAMGSLNSNTGYLCAGNLHKQIDSCEGDSGSPLVCQRISSCSWYVAGIVSFGHPTCGTVGFPGVYTDVREYESWITGITG